MAPITAIKPKPVVTPLVYTIYPLIAIIADPGIAINIAPTTALAILVVSVAVSITLLAYSSSTQAARCRMLWKH